MLDVLKGSNGKQWGVESSMVCGLDSSDGGRKWPNILLVSKICRSEPYLTACVLVFWSICDFADVICGMG